MQVVLSTRQCILLTGRCLVSVRFYLVYRVGLVDKIFGLVDLVNKALGLVNKPKRHFEMACMLLMRGTTVVNSSCKFQTPQLEQVRGTTVWVQPLYQYLVIPNTLRGTNRGDGTNRADSESPFLVSELWP